MYTMYWAFFLGMLTFLQLQEKRSSCVQPLRMATWSFTHSAVAMVLDGHYITITQPGLPILYKYHFHLKVKDESLWFVWVI